MTIVHNRRARGFACKDIMNTNKYYKPYWKLASAANGQWRGSSMKQQNN